MSKYYINVTIDPFAHNIAVNRTWIKSLIIKVIGFVKVKPPAEIDVLITCDKNIRELNKKFRGIDEITDVLSFYMLPKTSKRASDQFVAAPDGINHLGEVIISYEQTQKQATANKIMLEQELAGLLVHGILHLLGYDHELSGDRERMQSMERLLLASIRPFIFK